MIYEEPRTLEQACELAERYAEDGKILAGGTALVLLMRQKLLQPEAVVNIQKVPELAGITRTNGAIRVGAVTTHSQAARSDLLRAEYPALAYTFAKVATPRIRNAGTIGGNLSHGDPHLDPPVSLLALDATVTARSVRRQRELKLADFFLDYYETALQPGDVLTDVCFAARQAGEGLAFIKFLPRSQDDYAAVDSAAWVRMRAGQIADLRLAFGSVGPTTFRASDAEALLKGQQASADILAEAGRLAARAADPEDDVRGSAAYKRQLVEVLAGRVVRQAIEDSAR